MFIKNKIIRDTVLLTVMQLFLDSAALLLNVFINDRLGSSAMGVLSLTGAFLAMASILSNGNAFLCTSRLISEEIGHKNGSPDKVLFHGIKLCMIMSVIVSAAVVMQADRVGRMFFEGADISGPIKLIPAALICGAISSCLKGYFNACRKSAVTAAGDIIEFLVKSLFIVGVTLVSGNSANNSVCVIMVSGIAAGNVSSMIFFTVAYMRGHGPLRKNSTLDFKQYMKYALPIMGGGVLTTFLSSTNDALIPYCLRQNGDSTTEALSRFGIFEAIVIPTLFFPSVVLCSMSGIIVSETARASAAGNSERIQTLSGRIKDSTIMYAVFASAVLIRFGRTIGELIGGGELAGEIISLTAPVIPFIYLEIVLEAIIKGTGQQAFSSLNYLAEYIIRISSVLIIVPRIGFYGVVFSYYASNIIGNISRFIFLTRTTGMKINFIRSILVPVVYSFMTLSASELIFFLMHIDNKSPVFMVTEVIIWGAEYYTIMMLLGKIKINRTVNKKAVVHI